MARLKQTDFDQAARYLRGACETMERLAAAQTRGLRETTLAPAIERLRPEHRVARDVHALIITLRAAATRAQELGQADAAVDILKALAVLRDRAR